MRQWRRSLLSTLEPTPGAPMMRAATAWAQGQRLLVAKGAQKLNVAAALPSAIFASTATAAQAANPPNIHAHAGARQCPTACFSMAARVCMALMKWSREMSVTAASASLSVPLSGYDLILLQ